jgi:hypothetical protein
MPIRFLVPEALEFKEKLKSMFSTMDAEVGGKIQAEYYLMHIHVALPREALFFQNGTLRRKDASSFIKLIEDSLFEYLEVDDSRDLDIRCRKWISPDDTYRIYIYVQEDSLRELDSPAQFLEGESRMILTSAPSETG